MKIAYLLTHDIRQEDGVTKKITQQVKTWRAMGHEVEVFAIINVNEPLSDYCNGHRLFHNSMWLAEPRNLVKSILDYKPEIIYLRFEPFKPFINLLVRQFPTVLEINSDDISEYRLRAKKSIKGKLLHYYNLLTRRILLKKVAGLVGVTEELLTLPENRKYRKPSLVVPNGIDLKQFGTLKVPKENSIPQLVFLCSNDQPWQGTDKLIRLARNSIGKLAFHIIGVSLDKTAPPNMTYYGYLHKEEYESIMKLSDIGIGTLALHRKNMNEACPLKVREYLAYGLPVITGYNDTAFMGQEDLPNWLLEIPNTENNIDDYLTQIIDFSYKMKNFVLPKKNISFIDYNELEEKRLAFMASILALQRHEKE